MVDSTASTPKTVLADTILVLVHSNLLISLAATSVALSTMLLASLPVEPVPLFIVFAVTLFVYSFNKLADIAEDRENVPGRAAFVSQYGTELFAVGTILYLLATLLAIREGIPGAPAMVIPLLVAVLYSVVGLKRILLVKNLLVGLSWGLIVLGVGVYYGQLYSFDILFFFTFVTAALTIAAVVFDIKDIEGDRAEGVRTVPIVVGTGRTRQLAAGACLVLGGVVAGFLLGGVLTVQYIALLPYVGYMIGYSLVADRDRSPIFYGFIIDGEHIFLAAMLVAFELL